MTAEQSVGQLVGGLVAWMVAAMVVVMVVRLVDYWDWMRVEKLEVGLEHMWESRSGQV